MKNTKGLLFANFYFERFEGWVFNVVLKIHYFKVQLANAFLKCLLVTTDPGIGQVLSVKVRRWIVGRLRAKSILID